MSVATYTPAQQRLLARCGIDAESRFIDVPAVDGRAHVLITGEGPPVMMVIGGGVPTAIWAPLMAEFTGSTLYAVDPPGMGLTTRVPYTTEGLRTLAVEFLDQVVEGSDWIDRCSSASPWEGSGQRGWRSTGPDGCPPSSTSAARR